MKERPLPGWPVYEEDEIEAVRKVLASGKVNYWTGEEARIFEREFAEYHRRKHCVAVFNGTVALELCLYALGIGPGDEVIVPSRTFIASASCAVIRGATPVCVDIDADSQNLTADTIRPAITPRTKAIVCVHLAGWPCDMDPIMELARKHGLFVIEDCAQCHGARYKGKPVGSFGHLSAFSFCQDKIMTTGGEGGMVLTDKEEWWRKIWEFKDHGKSYDAVYNRSHPPGFRWYHESFGTNFRMTEVQAAIGRCQLPKLDGWVKARRANAQVLIDFFEAQPWARVAVPSADFYHSYYKFFMFVRPEKLPSGWTRNRMQEEINASGVPCLVGTCGEIYREKAFRIYPEQHAQSLPVARQLGDTCLMFQVHPTKTPANMQTEVGKIKEVLENP